MSSVYSESAKAAWAKIKSDPEAYEQRTASLRGQPGQKQRGYPVGRHKGEIHWNSGKPAWNRKERVVRECVADGCIEVISTPPSLARVRFCSHSCQARTTNRRNSVGVDADAYGRDWVPLRERTLERDENRCVLRCRQPGKRLEVHHLCYDASCRDEGHLVTLCSRCHRGGHRRGVWPLELGRVA